MGAYSLMSATIQAEMFDRNIVSADVVDYFDRFSETITKLTVVAIDNVSIHTAGKVKEKLTVREEKGLYLYYLPTYSPGLNLIEIIWRRGKYRWLPLKAYSSFDELWINLKEVLSEIGHKHILYLA